MRRNRRPCICGCGERAVQRHHVIYVQHLRWIPGASAKDERNRVPVAPGCHAAHHNRTRPFELSMLPDCVYGFAVEVLGADRAHSYLARRYAGTDPRLDALVVI